MRLAAFIIALLLLAGSIEPTAGWLAVLAALTGIAAFRIHIFWPFSPRPALDVRMAAFVLAVLLLAGTIEPTRGWLIALSAAAGVAMVCPGVVSLDTERRGMHWRGRRTRWTSWDWERQR
jgi:hypothetical protein